MTNSCKTYIQLWLSQEGFSLPQIWKFMHIVVAWNFFVTTVDSAPGGKGKGLTCKLSRDLEIFVHFVIVYLYICVFVYFCICVSLQKKREGLTCKLSLNLEICVHFVIVYLCICVYVYPCRIKERVWLVSCLATWRYVFKGHSSCPPSSYTLSSLVLQLSKTLSLSYLFAEDLNVFLHFWCRNALFLGHWAARK